MSDEVQEPKVEVSAPPKSIEIQSSSEVEEPVANPVMQNQGAMLTGGIGQTQGNLMTTMPQNVKFVMGPNGQMIAIEKPPFVWKHFFIGGGIPFAIFFVPMLILMIGTGLGYDEIGDNEQMVTLYKDENSTIYRGEFTLEEDNYLSGCGIQLQDGDYVDAYCDRYEDYKAHIYLGDSYNISTDQDEKVGHWNNENGTVYFDTGIDYGEELLFDVDYYDESYGFFMILGDISAFTCFLGLILSIVFLIVGFSQSKPGMGWGGVTALVSFPVVSFLSVLVMW
tara:strand:- start:619 stop:1458 length:840 start_codon:yes stop_codon:yes gene_type:complete